VAIPAPSESRLLEWVLDRLASIETIGASSALSSGRSEQRSKRRRSALREVAQYAVVIHTREVLRKALGTLCQVLLSSDIGLSISSLETTFGKPNWSIAGSAAASTSMINCGQAVRNTCAWIDPRSAFGGRER
jgi:hypothetical protein